MARADLLALEAEDLVVLSNRGIVKRAQAEVDSGDYTCEIAEEGGAVTVKWSDDVECLIPAGKGLADGRCSCPATTLCRHLVRSVLAYQRNAAAPPPPPTTEPPTPSPSEPPAPSEHPTPEHRTPTTEHPAPEHRTPNTEHRTPNTEDPTPDLPTPNAPTPNAPTPNAQRPTPDAPTPERLNARTPADPTPNAQRPTPWDPGRIPDAELERHFRKAGLSRARRQFDEGYVIELVRGVKPSAYVHTLSLNLRFLVPGDLAYTHCDCAESRPCSHVPLAVWAFRLLPEDRSGGLVSTRREIYPVPADLLDEVERALVELAVAGVQGAPRALSDRLRRLGERCRSEGLIWPAEILAELVQQHEAYSSHDARFAPRRVAELAAEFCARSDAIRADTGAVPQLFVRGSKADRVTEVGRAQMVGLGCGARIRRGGVELSAYLQDDRSGTVVAISREFADPPPDGPDAPKEFWELARASPITGISLSALGAGRLQIEGGKRTPGSRFLPGRSRATLNPHALRWEKQVRPPVLADDFAELAARLAAQPPASLRPRRVGSRLHVCPVAGVDGVYFSEAEQTLYALLRDASGGEALLAHPYTARAHHGSELLLARLRDHPEGLRFVAAEASLSGSRLLLRPVSAVFEIGSARSLVQPWVEGPAGDAGSAPAPPTDDGEDGSDPLGAFIEELIEAAGEQWLLGLNRADSQAARQWERLRTRGAGLGFHRLLRPVERLAAELEQRAAVVRWNPEPAAHALLELGVFAAIASERVVG